MGRWNQQGLAPATVVKTYSLGRSRRCRCRSDKLGSGSNR